MALALPLTKFTTSSPVVASYNYSELQSGIFYHTFYPLETVDASAGYSLIDNTIIYSEVKDTRQINTGVTTLTFDTSGFNIPRTVKGTAYCNIGEQHDLSSTGSVSARLYKYDGSSATAITAAHSRDCSSTGTRILSFEMPCTETLIAEGEQLRLVIVMTVGAGAGTWIAVGHDPKNQDGTYLTPSSEDVITSSRINVPFKFDS